ncbi:hypothetical protein BDV27DRAFT_156798 [Aspergillus caelatus]|uniref:POT family-domain-containing protein n=1 Tax=Aspergillus caelatus TaxID=61420 RepID=A0A5N7A8Q8_9EURO|nr:uncharacterized protein BDV27DRAFT_156798 [Aspergillus caelatus]KAE8365509.1 hypothetical protein BDV27DRAFT_156798 [Aspergillus caelatus]
MAIAPLIVEQHTEITPKVKVLKNGQKVITDRGLTVQGIYNVYYWVVNVRGLSALITTILEKYVGYWVAYLVPLCAVALSIVPLLVWRHTFVRRPPSGSVLPQAIRAMVYGIREGFQMDEAKPGKQQEKHHRQVTWTNTFIDELKSGLLACRVFLLLPINWLCLNQTFNNLISQAGQMVNSGVPNDTIKSLNPISSIILTPVVSRGLYPFLTRRRIGFGPMARIVMAFLFLTLAMAYTAILQKLVYSAGPCYDRPLACVESDHGQISNQISMFLQAPIYVLGAIAEIFCFTTGTEYAYNQAPKYDGIGGSIGVDGHGWSWGMPGHGVYAHHQGPLSGYHVFVVGGRHGRDNGFVRGIIWKARSGEGCPFLSQATGAIGKH